MGRLPKYTKQITLNQYPKIEKSLTKISNKNIMELRTGKTHIIRILLECIKYIIHETNIVFYPDSKSKDSSQTVAIHIELKSEEFEHYFCEEKTVMGINIMDLFKVIKSVDKDDIIFMYIEKDNPNSFFIQTENSKSGEITQTSISTIENEDEGLEIPELEFEQFLEIPSQRFQKICKDFNSFKVKEIKVELLDKQLAFSSKDEEIDRTVILQADIQDTDSCSKDNYMYKAVFTLAYFNHFTKATPLCDKVSLFLKNDGPFMIQYKIINIGEISFILSPNE